jgi:type II restriction enzyme
MNLSMTGTLAAAYQSGAQRARVVTESWGESNLYCPNCTSSKLTWLEPGHPASDYSCPKCGFWYQLKSQKSRIGDSITDGAYAAMMNAIRHDELPSFYFMQYEIIPSLTGAGEGGPDAAGPDEGRGEKPIKTPRPDPLPAQSRGEGMLWRVRNLLLVPHFAFPPSAIIKRKPLAPTARRAGWVGCNFALNHIPLEARIPVVTECKVTPATEVREKFKRVKPLKDLSVTQRGWTLDVLNIVRRLCEVGTARCAVRAPSGRNPAMRDGALPPGTP